LAVSRNAAVTPAKGREDKQEGREPSVGLLSYLRGDDLLEDRTSTPSEARALPQPDNELPLSGLPTVGSGPSFWKLTPVEALAIADVWAAVRVLSDSVSSLPLHAYRKTELGRERVTSGRLVDLLERPSPGVSEADLTSTLMSHLAIWGNGFIGKFRQQDEVTQLALIHPERIRPELQDGQLRYRYSPGTGPLRLLTEADIVHVKGLSVDGLNGLSAVSRPLVCLACPIRWSSTRCPSSSRPRRDRPGCSASAPTRPRISAGATSKG
jgi:Phage portal protein